MKYSRSILIKLILLCSIFGACRPQMNTSIGKRIVVKYETPVCANNGTVRKSNDQLPAFKLTPQQFILTGKEDTVLIGASGTEVMISPACFMHDDFSLVKDAITIELIEVYTKKDIVFSNKPTVSDGQLLETNGSLYINAIANGKPLLLGCPEGVKIKLSTYADPTMSMWLGTIGATGKVNWKIDSAMQIQNFQQAEGLFADSIEDDPQIYQYEEEVGRFLFSSKKLGWINCDRFYSDSSEKIDLQVRMRNPFPPCYQTNVYAVFTTINAVMPLYSEDGEVYRASSIPKGLPLTLVALSATELKTFFDMKPLVPEAGKKIEMELMPQSKTDIEEKLGQL